MKFLLDTVFDQSSGYGNDGVGLAKALAAAGHEVHLAPRSITPPIPPDVALMLSRDYTPPFDVVITHVDPPSIHLEPVYRKLAMRAVAWTMWEWLDYRDDYGPDGVRTDTSTLKERLQSYDLLLSYDPVTRDALAPHVPEGCMHRMLQGGYWPEDWKGLDGSRDWFEGTFRFVMVGQLGGRKDPFCAIRAFNILREEHGPKFDAELHLKTLIKSLHPGIEEAYPGIEVHWRHWNRAQMRRFYATSHCLLAPSRGEGKNMPALEAMTAGMAVIATDWGGHQVWMNSEYAYPLGYGISGGQAKADPEDLAREMWHVYTHREEAREKGRLAARTIPAMCSWEAVVRELMLAVEATPRRDITNPIGDDPILA